MVRSRLRLSMPGKLMPSTVHKVRSGQLKCVSSACLTQPLGNLLWTNLGVAMQHTLLSKGLATIICVTRLTKFAVSLYTPSLM